MSAYGGKGIGLTDEMAWTAVDSEYIGMSEQGPAQAPEEGRAGVNSQHGIPIAHLEPLLQRTCL